MSASQPAAPEPHEPEHALPAPADASLRAVADTDEVVWYVPAPEADPAVALEAAVPAPLDPPAAAEAAPVAKAPAKPRAKSTTAGKPKATTAKPRTAAAAKPKAAAAKPRATAAKPKTAAAKPRAATAKPRAAATPKTPAAAKPTAAKATTAEADATPKAAAKPRATAAKPAAAKTAGARATAKSKSPAATPAKPRAPRRKAVAWPAAAPQATPNAPVQAAPTPPADPASAPVPRAVPDPVGPSTAPAPDPTFVPQRPTIERREHVREPERRVPAFRSPPPAQPAPPAHEPAPASSEPAPVSYVAPAPTQAPTQYPQPAAPAYQPPAPEPDAYQQPAPQQPAAYQPPAPAPVAYQQPIAPQPEYQQPAAPAYEPPPAAYQQPAAPAYVPPAPAYEPPPAAYQQPAAPAYAPAPAPQPAAYEQPVAPQPAAYQQPPAPQAAPAPAPAAAPPVTHREAILAEAASKAPPGFTGPAILAAESPTLLALDPVEDETTRPAPVIAQPDTIGGSALLASARNAIPRSGDTKLFGREKDATIRVALATIVATVLVVVLGPPLASAIAKLPIVGPMLDQLKTFSLYPKAYGVASVAAVLGLACTTGIVYAQMEKTATKQGRRDDPTVRLNIALASLITLIVTAGLFSVMKRYGWASSASALGFFLATCLLVPLGNLPGARAMRHLPARAWAGAFVLSIAALVIYPSIPGALITLLTFTHVRTNWRAVSDGSDEHADGPVDGTNRKSAAMITGFVLIVAAVGMHVMTLSPDGVRESILSSNPAIPGTAVGPDIAPPKTP